MVLVAGRIYGSGHNKKGWFCLELATGRELYRDTTLNQGSLSCAEGMLYCLDQKDGTLALVPATPDSFTIVSRFQVPRGGEGMYWAHPVICGGRLYVRHADNIYAYDIGAK